MPLQTRNRGPSTRGGLTGICDLGDAMTPHAMPTLRGRMASCPGMSGIPPREGDAMKPSVGRRQDTRFGLQRDQGRRS